MQQQLNIVILAGCGKNARGTCHAERSEASALFASNKIQQMLRCAQHDMSPFSAACQSNTEFCYAFNMEGITCLALLLCDGASRAANGKINLHGIFDKIQIKVDPARKDSVVAKEKPAHLNNPTPLFYVFYKVAVTEPCTLDLAVEDPAGSPVRGEWRDEIPEPGLIQTVWCLNFKDFAAPGTYTFRLINDRETILETALEVSQAANGQPRSD
jgi:hypothetical protein